MENKIKEIERNLPNEKLFEKINFDFVHNLISFIGEKNIYNKKQIP